MSHFPRTLWVLLLAGALLRVAAIELRPHGALESSPRESLYLDIAHSLTHHEGFQLDGHPTASHDVLFPAVAAGIMQPFGDSPKPVLYFQLLLSCTAALLLYRIGLKRFGSSAALLLAGSWLFYPGTVLATALFVTVTLFLFLWIAALALHDHLEEQGFRIQDGLLLGLCVGLLVLTRMAGLILLASLVLYIAFLRYGPHRPTHWPSALIILLAAVLTITPWMVRNKITVGHLALNTRDSLELPAGEMPQSPAFPQVDSEDSPSAAQPVSSVDSQKVSASIGQPFVNKIVRIWDTDVGLWGSYCPPLRHREWNLLTVTAASLPGMLALCLGAAGLFLARRFPQRKLLLLQLLLSAVALTFTFGLPRDQFVVLPALLIGATALWQPGIWIRASLMRRVSLIFTLCIFCGMWLWGDLILAGV